MAVPDGPGPAQVMEKISLYPAHHDESAFFRKTKGSFRFVIIIPVPGLLYKLMVIINNA